MRNKMWLASRTLRVCPEILQAPFQPFRVSGPWLRERHARKSQSLAAGGFFRNPISPKIETITSRRIAQEDDFLRGPRFGGGGFGGSTSRAISRRRAAADRRASDAGTWMPWTVSLRSCLSDMISLNRLGG